MIDFLRTVFGDVNLRVSRKMSRMPTVHETSLDLTLIEAVSHHTAPLVLGSGWTVRLDTHYLGGGRHFGSGEVADIGVLVMFRRAGTLIGSKVGLLQSKRLYPTEQDFDEDQAVDYMIGFGRLHEDERTFLAVTEPRRFSFDKSSRYEALAVADKQWKTIQQYENLHSIPVHYLLYHPLRVASSASVPRQSTQAPRGPCRAGARVLPADSLRRGLQERGHGYVPSYGDLEFLLPSPFDVTDNVAGWRLERFVAELLVTCHEGYVTGSRFDEACSRYSTNVQAPSPPR